MQHGRDEASRARRWKAVPRPKHVKRKHPEILQSISSCSNLQETDGKMDMFFCSHPQSEGVMNLFSIHHRVHKLIHELQTKMTVLKERPSALKTQTRRLNIQTLSYVAKHFLVYYMGKCGCKSTPYSYSSVLTTTVGDEVVYNQREKVTEITDERPKKSTQ